MPIPGHLLALDIQLLENIIWSLKNGHSFVLRGTVFRIVVLTQNFNLYLSNRTHGSEIDIKQPK